MATILTVALALGCSADEARSAQALSAEPLDPAAAPMPDAHAAPEVALDALAKRYASGLVADGAPMEGTLTAGGRLDYLAVLRGGSCYRVLAAGEESLQDLDLALFDPTGVLITEDPGQDRYPVLGMNSDVCPVSSGSYRVQAHAYVGQGRFALRIWRSGP
jgi:hypothetical protein